MKKIVNSGQMAGIDSTSVGTFGLSAEQLMEQAGLELGKRIISLASEKGFSSICIIAGSGHNGGDGFVIARMLNERFAVTIVNSSAGKSGLWNKNAAICSRLGIPIFYWENENDRKAVKKTVAGAECIIDCLTGTGLPGPARGAAAELIGLIGKQSCFTVSVDIPSGIYDGFREDDAAVKADLTLTVSLPKTSFYSLLTRPFCGKIEPVKIGFPAAAIETAGHDAWLIDTSDISLYYTRLKPESYKNTKGHLAVFAGNTGTAGAAWLSSTAAGHSGCGLVSTVCADAVYNQLASSMPSVMVKGDHIFNISDKDALRKFNAFCAGPGMGRTDRQKDKLKSLLQSGMPGVIDADAISLFAGMYSRSAAKKNQPLRYIFTPHPGEFRVLYNAVFAEIPPVGPESLHAVKKLAEELNAVILYKASFFIAAVPGEPPYIADGMFAPLAVAGAGDVLAGLAGGLLARAFSCRNAAICAALVLLGSARNLYAQSGLFNSAQLADYIGREMALYEA